MAQGAAPKASRSAAPAEYAARLAAGFGVLVALGFALIVLGALVRAKAAGLACPDWPLCFGQWLPSMDLRVAFEFAHRVAALSLTLAFLGLSALALRRPATRRAAPLLAVGAGLLAAQILLGALTVWQRLAPWTVTVHLLTGNAFAATLLLAALELRESRSLELPHGRPLEPGGGRPLNARDAAAAGAAREPAPASARRWIVLAAALLALQMALGGLVASRYAGLACPEWPACRAGIWFPTWQGPVGLHLLHRTNGYALAASLAAAAWAARRAPGLCAATRLGLGLATTQVAVGAANVRLGLPVEVTALHSALAAALVLTLTWAARVAWLGARAGRGARS